jgi:P pilus assembly chaperone PapD
MSSLAPLLRGASLVQRLVRTLPLSLFLALALVVPGIAMADLLVFPTRLVFEGNERAAQLDLHNSGKETATYRISLVNRRMTDIGAFTDVDQPVPGELFSDGMIRFSPRQVVLAPGASQTVRISVRKPAELAAGEYRSHLHFERLPEASGRNSVEGTDKPGEVGVQLKILMGVTVPVIVRHGATSATVKLADLDLAKSSTGGPATLGFVLHRTGNRSVYGDLGATFTPNGGAEQQVGKAAGLAVYAPNALRRGRLELHPPAGLALVHGTLRLTYRERADAGGKLLAEALLPIP